MKKQPSSTNYYADALQCLVESSKQLLIYLNQELSIGFINQRCSEVLQWDRASAIDTPLCEMNDSNNLGIAIDNNFPNQFKEFTCTYPREGGELYYITWQLTVVSHSEESKGYWLLGNDVTEFHFIQKSAESSSIVVENLITNLPFSVWWKDRQGVYQGCNDYLLYMAGVKARSEIIGKTDSDLVWAGNADDFRIIDEQVMSSGKSSVLEESGTLAQGRKIFLSHKLPMYDKDRQIVGLMGLSFDITERKQLETELREAKEAAEAANEAKSDFIANMSHDLRTPLVAICGIGEILKFERSFSVEERKGLASDLAKSAEVLLQLVDNILDFSKLKSDKLPIISEAFDLREIIETVTIMMAELANKKNIKLLIYYSEACPRYLIGDPHRVNRIVTNLIGNAIKFTGQGHVFVSVELIRQQEFEVELQIVVEDTGIGIPTRWN